MLTIMTYKITKFWTIFKCLIQINGTCFQYGMRLEMRSVLSKGIRLGMESRIWHIDPSRYQMSLLRLPRDLRKGEI
jgi:hypothetical protein